MTESDYQNEIARLNERISELTQTLIQVQICCHNRGNQAASIIEAGGVGQSQYGHAKGQAHLAADVLAVIGIEMEEPTYRKRELFSGLFTGLFR